MIPFNVCLGDARVMASVIDGNISTAPSTPDVTDPTILAKESLPDVGNLQSVLDLSMSTWFTVLQENLPQHWSAAAEQYRVHLIQLLGTRPYTVNITDQLNWKPIVDPTTNQVIGHITTFVLVDANDPTRRFETSFLGARIAVHITLSLLKV